MAASRLKTARSFTIRRQYYRGELRNETKTAAGMRSVALMPSLMRDPLRHRAATPYSGDGHTDEAFTRRVYIHPKETPRFDAIDVPVVQAVG